MEHFNTMMGVRHGCSLSLLLFSFYFDRVVKHINNCIAPIQFLLVDDLTILVAIYAAFVAFFAPKRTSI